MRNEELILKNLLHNEEYLRKVIPFLQPEYFSDKSDKIVFNLINEHFEKYNAVPTLAALSIILNNEKGIAEYDHKDCAVLVQELGKEYEPQNMDWLLSFSEKFCKDKAVFNAIMASINIIDGNDKQYSQDHIPELLNKALAISFDQDIGHDYFENAENRYDFYHTLEEKVPFDLDIFNKITKGGLPGKSLTVILASTGCHSKDTPILLSSGQIKLVQDIVVGDKLIGDDGASRTVTELVHGNAPMFEICVNGGDKFTVNGEHILSLVKTGTDNVINMSVYDYIGKNNHIKHLYKTYYNKSIINFKPTYDDLKLEPYFVGLYLGDGSTRNIAITTIDHEISSYCYNIAKHYGICIRETSTTSTLAKTYHFNGTNKSEFGRGTPRPRNLIGSIFDEYGLHFINSEHRTTCEMKFIPHQYKCSSIENRLELLAGLIDSDGSIEGSKRSSYSITSKSRQLANDIVFVARSLAFYAKLTERVINNTIYYRVSICFTHNSPDSIPTKLSRKTKYKSTTSNKNLLHRSFTINQLGVGDYYGFKVDGNNLYTMGNFIVTHNCGKSMFMCHMASYHAKIGKNVLYISLEMAEERIGERLDCNILDITFDELDRMDKQTFLTKIDKAKRKSPGRLVLKEYPTSSASAAHFRVLLEELKVKKNFQPDIIFIDYLGICASARYKNSGNVNSYNYSKSVAEELRGLGMAYNVPVVTAVQVNRSGTNNSDPEWENVAESHGIAMTADLFFALYASEEMQQLNQIMVKLMKNRWNSLDFYRRFLIGVDKSKMKLYNLDQPNGNIHMSDTKTEFSGKSAISFENWS